LDDINKKIPKGSFPEESSPSHTFLTTQPIHTNSNWIDAARQTKYDTELKSVTISI
jgi:hypothetical protein